MTVSPTAPGEIAPVMRTALPAVTIGGETPTDTDGGGPTTRTVPRSVGCSASRYPNVPGVSIRRAHVPRGRMIGDAKAPLLATTWWFTVSRFVQATVSPPLTVTALGTKPVERMATVFVAR